MPAFKSPDFNERTAAARAAKERALEQLRAKPAPDPAVLAAQAAAREEREAAANAARIAKKAAAEEAKAAEKLAKEEARAAAEAAAQPVGKKGAPKDETPEGIALAEAEKKAARDARYAARKKRKR